MMKRSALLILLSVGVVLSFPVHAEMPVEAEISTERGTVPAKVDCQVGSAEFAKALPNLDALLLPPAPITQSDECGYLWVDPACFPCGGHEWACTNWCSDKGGVKSFQGCEGSLYCECNNGCFDSSACCTEGGCN